MIVYTIFSTMVMPSFSSSSRSREQVCRDRRQQCDSCPAQATYGLVVRRTHTRARNAAVQDAVDGDTARHTDGLGHGGVATDLAVSLESAGQGLERAVGVLDLKLVLKHDEVDLVRSESELLLEKGTQGVEHVATGGDLPVREQAERAELRDDERAVLLEGVELLELENDAATNRAISE